MLVLCQHDKLTFEGAIRVPGHVARDIRGGTLDTASLDASSLELVASASRCMLRAVVVGSKSPENSRHRDGSRVIRQPAPN